MSTKQSYSKVIIIKYEIKLYKIETSTFILLHFLTAIITNYSKYLIFQVRWFLDDKLLKEVPECNYTISKNGGEFCDIEPNLLNLTKVTESYAGNYSCQGQNVAGWGLRSEPRELIVYCELMFLL